jgi:malate permease and related proteins
MLSINSILGLPSEFHAIVLALAAGVILGRVGYLDRKTAGEALNKFVMGLLMPALILSIAPKLKPSLGDIHIIVLPWLLLLLSAGLVLLAGRLLAWPRPVVGCLLIVLPLGNTAFLGYPMIRALLGEAALPTAVLYDQFGSFLALSLYVPLVVAHYTGKTAPSIGERITRVLTFPPFISLLIGCCLGAFGFRWPEVVSNTLELVSHGLIPAACCAIGLSLTASVDRWSALLLAVLAKLALMPLIALALAALIGLPADRLQVVVLQAAMPCMISAGLVAISADLAPRLASAIVSLSLLLGLVSLPLWLRVVQQVQL